MTSDRLLEGSGRGTASRAAAFFRASFTPLACGTALGVTYGNIGGAITDPVFLQRYHNPSDNTLQGLAAIMQAGCVFGSITASYAADRFGRRACILVSMMLVALSSTVLLIPAVASENDSLAPLFLGRLLSGLGGGIACAVVPMHVSEVAPAAHRGAIEASFQLAVETGILIAYTLNLVLGGTELGWCVSLAAALPLAAGFLAWASAYLLESPRYLMHEARDEAAEAALGALRTPDDDVKAELAGMRAERGHAGSDDADGGRGGASEGAAAGGSSSAWAALLQPAHRSSAGVAVTVLALQELTYTLLVGVVFVLVTPFAIYAVDRCGRRLLLLLGGGGMTLSLAGLALFYDAAVGGGGGAASHAASPEGARDGGASSSSALPTLCVVLLLSYVACFSFSWGPVAWVIPSELVAYNVRAKVVALGTVLNWLADYAVIGSFLSLTNAIGEAGGFATFAAINLAAVLFVYFCVPETKGTHLEGGREADRTNATSVPGGSGGGSAAEDAVDVTLAPATAGGLASALPA